MNDSEINEKEEDDMQKQIMIPTPHYHCNKCDHLWQGRAGARDYPRMCPKCKSICWDEPIKEDAKE